MKEESQNIEKVYLVKRHPIYASVEEFQLVGKAETNEEENHDFIINTLESVGEKYILKIDNKLIMVDLNDVFMERNAAIEEALKYTKERSRYFAGEIELIKRDLDKINERISIHDINFTNIIRKLNNIRRWASSLPIFKFNREKDYGKDA